MTPGFQYFDTDDTGDNYRESHAAEWHRGPLPAGTYTVQAKFAVASPPGSTRFTLHQWHMTVEQWRVT